MRSTHHSRMRTFVPAALAAALTVGLAQAQQPQSTAAGTLNAPLRQAAQEQQAGPYHGLRASQVIGMSVRSPQGQNIGQVEDIVLNTNNGKVRYAMLRFDPGWLSGERVFAVPMSQMRMAQDRNDMVLDVTRERLERAAIDRSAWNKNYFADLNRIQRIDEAWGVGQRDMTPVVRASDLLDNDFRAVDGKVAGEVEEIVINAGREQVHYVIAGMDPGWLGEERRVVLPIRAFQRSGDGELTLNMNPGKVRAMGSFDESQYANLNDRGFLSNIDRLLILVPVTGEAAGTRDRVSTAPSNGVPGVDADVSTSANGAAETNGVPGMDMDVSTSAAGPTLDASRTMGAGPALQPQVQQTPIQDRN